MSEITVEQIIKLILGVLVFVAVVVGAYFIFKNKIINFFGNMAGGEVNLVLSLIK